MGPPPVPVTAADTTAPPPAHADGPVLIVEPDDTFRDQLLQAVRDNGMDAVAVASGGAALEVARTRVPRVAVVATTLATDGSGPWTRGLLTASALRRAVSPPPSVLVVSDACVVAGLLRLEAGPVAVLPRSDLAQLVVDIRDPSAALARCQQRVREHLGSVTAAPT